MSGLTQTPWVASTVNGHTVLKCSLTQASATIYDSWTYKTPRELDPTKPWILVVNTAGASMDATTVPVDLWVGFDDNAALADNSGTGVTATNAAEIAGSIMDEVDDAKLASRIDPNYTGAVIQSVADTAGMINAGKAPYYIVSLDGTTGLDATTCAIVITQ